MSGEAHTWPPPDGTPQDYGWPEGFTWAPTPPPVSPSGWTRSPEAVLAPERPYRYVGEITREYEIMEVDGYAVGTEAIAEIQECLECGDAVLNTVAHDRFHQRIDEAILHPMIKVETGEDWEAEKRVLRVQMGLPAEAKGG